MKQIKIFILLMIMASAVILAGCQNDSDTVVFTANGKDIDTIRYTQMKFYDPVFIAKEKGFFEEEGINLKFVGELYAGPEMIQAISGGSADMGSTAITALINARAKGFKVTGITDVQTSYSDEPIHKWFTLKDSGINGPQDFIGKKISVNSLGASFHYTTLEYLRQNGISEDEVEFVTLPHPNMQQALFSEQIDIAGMVKPFSNHALLSEEKEVKELFDTVDVFGPGMQVVTGVVSDKFAQENPQAITKFIRAYNKALDFITEHPEEARKIFSEVLGVEEEYITHQKYQPDGRVDFESIQKWIDILEERGDIKQNSVTVEDVVTNEFNPFIS